MNKLINLIIMFVFIASFIFGNDLPESPEAEERAESEGLQQSIESEIDIIDITAANDPDVLWQYFLSISDNERRAQVLTALGKIGKGNRAAKAVIDNLNNYFLSMNLSYKSGAYGAASNYILVSAFISAIMEAGDSSSYQALFAAVCAGYPEVITSEAFGALEIIPGNLHQFLLNVIWNNPPDEKFAAYRIAMNSERFSISQRGQIAELALDQALEAADDNINLNVMRFSSVVSLTKMRWTRASALAIKHYYRVQSEVYQNINTKERLIEAVKFLGAAGDSQAALILGLQLGLINARMESTQDYDDEITLAIVQALGQIGDSAAFDHLLYVNNLSYNDRIKAAAREAIGNLKWSR